MQDAQVVARSFEHICFEYVYVLDALILHEVGEALALHAGHIEDVGIGDGLLGEVGVLYILDAVLLAVEFVFVGHGEFLGGDEVELRVEVAHGHQERVYRTAVLEVAHEVDVQILQCALRLVDGIEVEHRL